MTIMSPHFHSLKTDEPTGLLRLAERRSLAVTRRAAGCSRAPLPCGSPVPGHRGGCPTRPARPEAPPLPARPRRPRGGGARWPRRGRGCVTAPAPRAPRARSRASRAFTGITRVRGRARRVRSRPRASRLGVRGPPRFTRQTCRAPLGPPRLRPPHVPSDASVTRVTFLLPLHMAPLVDLCLAGATSAGPSAATSWPPLT